MLIMTMPWHIVGLMGQPRYAIFDYSDPAVPVEREIVEILGIGADLLEQCPGRFDLREVLVALVYVLVRNERNNGALVEDHLPTPNQFYTLEHYEKD